MTMLVDSHCHLDFPELAADVPGALADMAAHGVTHALCISVTLEDFPKVRALAEEHANLYATVGTHPDYPDHPLVTAGAPRSSWRRTPRSSASARPGSTITA